MPGGVRGARELHPFLTGAGDALERIEFALLLYRRARHAESARMYAEAFAEDVALAQDLAEGHRYDAACSASLEHWKQDPDLAAVRDRLPGLPEPESEAWRTLWAAVDRALAAAGPAAE